MGRDNQDLDQQERIKEIQEKYKSNDDDELFNSSGEPESLGFIEEPELNDEVDEKFQCISDSLEPCKTELSNLEEELRNLKRKFKTPMEMIALEKSDSDINDNNNISDDKSHYKQKQSSRRRVRTFRGDCYQANEDDIKHMVCDSKGRTYQVHIPSSVLSLDSMDDEFAITSDTVLCKIREGVVTRIGVCKTDDNNVTIAGLAVMSKLGLTNADLQTCIDTVVNEGDGHKVDIIGERVVEMMRHKKRLLTRVVFSSDPRLQSTVLLSWYAASIIKIF